MKMFNSGAGYTESVTHGVPTIKREEGEFVQVPPLFTGGKVDHVKHEPGNVYIPLFGHGFFVVSAGKSFDVPSGVSAATVKAIAPHMLTEEEHNLIEKQKAKSELASPSKKKD